MNTKKLIIMGLVLLFMVIFYSVSANAEYVYWFTSGYWTYYRNPLIAGDYYAQTGTWTGGWEYDGDGNLISVYHYYFRYQNGTLYFVYTDEDWNYSDDGYAYTMHEQESQLFYVDSNGDGIVDRSEYRLIREKTDTQTIDYASGSETYDSQEYTYAYYGSQRLTTSFGRDYYWYYINGSEGHVSYTYNYRYNGNILTQIELDNYQYYWIEGNMYAYYYQDYIYDYTLRKYLHYDYYYVYENAYSRYEYEYMIRPEEWRDANQNGIREPGEILQAAQVTKTYSDTQYGAGEEAVGLTRTYTETTYGVDTFGRYVKETYSMNCTATGGPDDLTESIRYEEDFEVYDTGGRLIERSHLVVRSDNAGASASYDETWWLRDGTKEEQVTFHYEVLGNQEREAIEYSISIGGVILEKYQFVYERTSSTRHTEDRHYMYDEGRTLLVYEKINNRVYDSNGSRIETERFYVYDVHHGQYESGVYEYNMQLNYDASGRFTGGNATVNNNGTQTNLIYWVWYYYGYTYIYTNVNGTWYYGFKHPEQFLNYSDIIGEEGDYELARRLELQESIREQANDERFRGRMSHDVEVVALIPIQGPDH